MKKILFSVLLILCSLSYAKSQSLEVQVDGWDNDTILLSLYSYNGDDTMDTIVAAGGRVIFELPLHDTCYVSMTSFKSMFPRTDFPLQLDAMTISTVMAPGLHEKIVGKMTPRALVYTSSGSIPYFKQAAELRSQYLEYNIAADSVNILIETGVMQRQDADILQPLFDERGRNYGEIRRIKLEYARLHPGDDLAADCVSDQHVQEFRAASAILTPEAWNGLFKNALKAQDKYTKQYEGYLEAQKRVTVGCQAPDFTLPTLDGRQVSLSDFKGQWVLLDFWGSWCGWCIQGFPDMKKYYEANKDKLQVVGIACKDAPEKCAAAVERYQLPWIQLIEMDNSAESVSVRYAVASYPDFFLISPDGIITEIFHGKEPGFYEKIDQHIKAL